MQTEQGGTAAAMAGRRIGKYQVTHELGRGGMAELVRASLSGPAGFTKQVALKRVLPEHARDQEFVRMFLAEAELAARLSHPNVVQVFDFGECDGEYYLAMEFLEGEDLRALLRRQGALQRLPPLLAAQIMAGAAEGLHYAHTLADTAGQPLSLVHRDVTPSNLFITRQGVTKVLDFGVARTTQSQNNTSAGVLKGKIPYLSPEQVNGMAVDARSDVWSLGVVLYEILTGKRPFDGSSDFKILSAIAGGPIPRPSELNAAVPADLDELTMASLQRDVDQRLKSADVLRQGLARFVRAHTQDSGLEEVARFMAGHAAPAPSCVQSDPRPQERPVASAALVVEQHPTRVVQQTSGPSSTGEVVEPGSQSASAGSTSRASKTLIATLTAQHVSLKHSAIQLSAAVKASNFVKARDLLGRLEKVLLAHMKLEDARLYPELAALSRQLQQPEMVELADQFSGSMRGIMDVLADFITRAKAPGGDKHLAADWPGVAEALATRIEAEECTLYPMHLDLAEACESLEMQV